jgi:hypothetical protein
MTRSTAGASCGPSAGLPCSTAWSRTTTPSFVVGDLGLVPELDGLAEPALSDRPGVGVVQADPPGRPVRHRARRPLPGLRRDPTGDREQPDRVVDGTAQPAPPPARRGVLASGRGQRGCPRLGPVQRPARAGQQPPRFGGGALGQPGQLPGRPATVACRSSRACAARERGLEAIAYARRPAARLRSRTFVRVAPAATGIRRPAAAMPRTVEIASRDSRVNRFLTRPDKR